MMTVMIEHGHELLGKRNFDAWPAGGLKGVLSDYLKKSDSGWYVVTAIEADAVLSKQGFLLDGNELHTHDLTYVDTTTLNLAKDD